MTDHGRTGASVAIVAWYIWICSAVGVTLAAVTREASAAHGIAGLLGIFAGFAKRMHEISRRQRLEDHRAELYAIVADALHDRRLPA